ncbi:MAG: hypothetical protein KGZ65_06210 [Sphingomonadales bacterium]|nr:hypothetical protein [Sphingomonadaceae bacterium]MBS3930813.1 hypothetical protein [Sphingomonadales bacterium]
MSNFPEGVAMPFLDDAPDYIDCDECGEEVGANEVSEVDGRTLCDTCNPPTTLAQIATRKFGLRESGGRL